MAERDGFWMSVTRDRFRTPMFSLLSSTRAKAGAAYAACRSKSSFWPWSSTAGSLSVLGSRFRHQLAPRKVKYIKRHKGVIPIPIGGSTKGTTLAYGKWGLRIKGNGVRLTAKQLQTAEEVIKRKIKQVKGSKVYLRVFPDIPVCIKVTSTSFGRPSDPLKVPAAREMKRVWVRARERLSTGRHGMSLSS
jgi:ribosomal protein L16